jgi:hypothetical protein
MFPDYKVDRPGGRFHCVDTILYGPICMCGKYRKRKYGFCIPEVKQSTGYRHFKNGHTALIKPGKWRTNEIKSFNTRDVRKVHILLHFLLYNNTYVVQILSAKIYISSEHIYQKLLNSDLRLYFYSIYIQHIYIVMEHFDSVNGVNLMSCLSTIQFLPI